MTAQRLLHLIDQILGYDNPLSGGLGEKVALGGALDQVPLWFQPQAAPRQLGRQVEHQPPLFCQRFAASIDSP